MKILMTGASGLVGGEILRQLIDKGFSDFVFLTRDARQLQQTFAFPCKIFSWNIEQPVPCEALEGVESIIHLAGESIAGGRWTKKRKKELVNSRVLGTRSLVLGLKALGEKNSKLKVFVSASAIGLYGDQGNKIISEDNPVKEKDFLSQLCYDWELESKKLSTFLPQVRLVHFRLGIVLSQRGGALEKMLPPFQCNLGGPIGNGKHYMSWIHLEDAASFFVWALENDQVKGSYNAVAPEAVTNTNFTQTLAKTLKRFAVFPLPALMLKILFGEMSSILLVSQRVIPARALSQGKTFRYSTLISALKNLLQEERQNESTLVQFMWMEKRVDDVFQFFMNPHNLEKITPQTLGFQILKTSDQSMREGLIIDYKIKLHGIPLQWQTEIAHYRPPHSFIDIQKKGPYRKWHHLHQFFPFQGGTLMVDRVHYILPGGLIGKILGSFVVKKELKMIFAFRRSHLQLGEKS